MVVTTRKDIVLKTSIARHFYSMYSMYRSIIVVPSRHKETFRKKKIFTQNSNNAFTILL